MLKNGLLEKDLQNSDTEVTKLALVVPFGDEPEPTPPPAEPTAEELFEKVKSTDLFKTAISSAVEEATAGLRENRDTILAEKKELESYKKMFKQAADDAELSEALQSGDTSIKKLLDDRVQSARSDMQKVLEQKDQELAELQKQIAGSDQRLKEFRIKDVIGSAALKNEFFQQTAVDDLMVLAKNAWDMDDNGNLVPRDGNGNVLIGKDGNALAPEAWVSSLTESRPHYFKPMAGSGANGGKTVAAGATYTRSEWQSKMLGANEAEKQQLLKARETGQVTIAG